MGVGETGGGSECCAEFTLDPWVTSGVGGGGFGCGVGWG